MPKDRRISDHHKEILRKMQDGWELIEHWPEPEKRSCFLRKAGETDIPVSVFDCAFLSRKPRFIRHYSTDRVRMFLYFTWTPAAERAVASLPPPAARGEQQR